MIRLIYVAAIIAIISPSITLASSQQDVISKFKKLDASFEVGTTALDVQKQLIDIKIAINEIKEANSSSKFASAAEDLFKDVEVCLNLARLFPYDQRINGAKCAGDSIQEKMATLKLNAAIPESLDRSKTADGGTKGKLNSNNQKPPRLTDTEKQQSDKTFKSDKIRPATMRPTELPADVYALNSTPANTDPQIRLAKKDGVLFIDVQPKINPPGADNNMYSIVNNYSGQRYVKIKDKESKCIQIFTISNDEISFVSLGCIPGMHTYYVDGVYKKTNIKSKIITSDFEGIVQDVYLAQ